MLQPFLAHLAKGNVSFSHHLASVVCHPLTFHIRWAMQAQVRPLVYIWIDGLILFYYIPCLCFTRRFDLASLCLWFLRLKGLKESNKNAWKSKMRHAQIAVGTKNYCVQHICIKNTTVSTLGFNIHWLIFPHQQMFLRFSIQNVWW